MVWACDEVRGNKSNKSDYEINVEGKRRKERPKNRWLITIKNYMKASDVYVGDVENRDEEI
jgi:hypothetical protein